MNDELALLNDSSLFNGCGEMFSLAKLITTSGQCLLCVCRHELLAMVSSETANSVEAMRLDLLVNRLALLCSSSNNLL